MPTINQLPPATEVDPSDELLINQNGIDRSVTVDLLLDGTQAALTLPRGALLGRVSNGPGSPETVALGTGLQIVDDVLLVDHSSFPQIGTLSTDNQVILNDPLGAPLLMPISLLRGLYTAGQNITIEPNGTITSTPTAATGNSIGSVAIGNGLVINASGQLSVNVGTVSGTVAAGNDPRIVGAEQIANKGVPGGYAALDATGKVPATQLPPGSGGSGVSSIDGRTGAITLTTADIGGLGSLATQSANAVSITGGSVSATTVSAATASPAFANSISRTLSSHFSDVVNINDFGLARDGQTDDSAKFIAACQAAMAADLKLYIPSGGPILLTDNAQQNLANIHIFGDGIRDYDGPSGYGHYGSVLWFTGRTKTPFLLGASVQFEGLNFFWPNQTKVATASNNNLPLVYPPLFGQQSPAINIVYFNFIDCQVTNCYDFFTATGTSAVVGACTVERCIIYAINTGFTLQFVPEVFFIANCLFTFGVYGSVVSVGPTYNLRTYTNTQGTWMKVLGDGTTTSIASSTVGGIMSTNVYVFGSSRGIWLAAGTLDISAFVNTSFDNVPTVIQGDPGCAMFSTRFTGGAWYPIYFASGSPDTTAIQISNPAPGGLNGTFSGITIPFINGSLATIAGTNIAALSFSDLRCSNIGHTAGGTGPYHGFQFNTPNAVLRVHACDFAPSNGGLQNTGVQILACSSALISDCTFTNMSAPIDVETTSGQVTLSGNTTTNTQAVSCIDGVATTNLHDLFNNWDKPTLAYNGLVPNIYRANATIGIQPVACTTAAGYIGVQPSAIGSSGGTRIGLTAAGTGVVSLLTNTFNEEQFRANRQIGAVNYVAVRGSLSGSPSLITANGADATASIQLTAASTGNTYLGSQGITGSTVVYLGASADQSYVGTVPANAFFFAVPANCSTVLLKPAATLATGTMSLPAASTDGERIEIWTSKTITSLTVVGQSGTIVNNNTFQLPANTSVGFFWNAPNSTWFQRLGGGSSNGSIAQQDASNVAITGGSITGLSNLSVGGGTAIAANLLLNAAAGFGRQVVYQTAGLTRWVAGAQGTPENNTTTTSSAAVASGAANVPLTTTTGITAGMLVSATGIVSGTTVVSVNADSSVTLSQPVTSAIGSGASVLFYTNQGSDYAILPFDDTGAPLSGTLGQSLLITRATGQVSIKTLAVIGTANAPTPAMGDSSTQVATTAFVANNAIPPGKLGVASGVATLDGAGHLPASQLPTAAQGALDYQGVWNASSNTPALSSGAGTKGFYYTVGTAGSTVLDGIAQWNAGDHAAFNGSAWEKLDGLASEVISVAGRTGAITLNTTDIGGINNYALLASPTFTGTPNAPTPASSDNSVAIATTAYTTSAVASEAAARMAADSLQLNKANNLSDLGSASSSRSNLGLGTLATQNATAVALTGGAVSGLTTFGIGSNTGPTINATLNAAAGNPRQLVFQTAGNSRWNALALPDVEGTTVGLTTSAPTTSSTILNFSTVSGISVGMSAAGVGITAGSLVTAFTSTTVTISLAATVAASAAISFYPNTGSSFALRAYDDGGNLLYAPLQASRATGAALTLGTLSYGAIVIQGGSAILGNTRGLGALDAQQYRSTATQVASGQYAATFGSGNTASGSACFAAGQFNAVSASNSSAFGNSNTVSGSYSFAAGASNTLAGSYGVVFGSMASDRGRYGTATFASGDAAAAGDTQTAFGILRAVSTTTAATRLSADGNTAGSANVWNIPNSTVFKIRIEILGWNASGVQAVGYTAAAKLVRGSSASTTRLTNATMTADADNDSITGLTAPTLAADTTNGGLNIGSGFSTSVTMRWAARVISAVELQ